MPEARRLSAARSSGLISPRPGPTSLPLSDMKVLTRTQRWVDARQVMDGAHHSEGGLGSQGNARGISLEVHWTNALAERRGEPISH